LHFVLPSLLPRSCLALASLCLPTFAQVNSGRIFGAITDQNGRTVAGATVSVINVDRDITRRVITNASGQYSAPNLIPGNYTVRAEATALGLRAPERRHIDLAAGQEVRVDLTLQPAEQIQLPLTGTHSGPV
jgi:hypothetical protein